MSMRKSSRQSFGSVCMLRGAALAVAFGFHSCARWRTMYMTALIMIAVCCSLPVSAKTYYVATNGVDAAGRGSEAEPFETIQYAIEEAESDSTIWVKPGVYDKGCTTNRLSSGAIHTNRVSLTKKIHLKSTNGAAVTHIVGAPDPNTGGVGPAAIRCMVSPNGDSEGSTIVGFTLRGGYGDTAAHRSGGFLQNNGNKWIYFYDCVISNCVSFTHAAARGGTFARCLFVGNRSTTHSTSAPMVGMANLVSCVLVGNGDDDSDYTVGDSSTPVNCTIVCNRGTGVTSGVSLYNCVVCGNSNGDYSGSKAYGCAIGGYNIVSPLECDWRVVSGGAADGSGDPSYLTSNIPFTVAPGMADTDFGGNEIDTSGTSVHAGAVQTAAPVSGGVLWLYGPLSCNGASVAEGVPTYAQSTNGLSQWRVSFARGVANGSSMNYLNRISRTSPVGNTTLVPDLNDSLVMMAPPKAGVVTTNTPIYSKAFWVSPSGSDTDNDGSEADPYATIQKAVDTGGSRTVIFLGPGLYCEGGLSGGSAAAAPYGSSRVWVPGENVRIIGGGAANTVIAGSPDPVTHGFGEKAVKCIGGLQASVVVQGVTLSNGWTRAESGQLGHGAAIRGITLADSVVTCCRGYNNIAYSANMYRCKVFGNESQNDSLLANYSRAVCSWIGPNSSSGSTVYYGYIGSSCEAWFSTLIVQNGQSAFSQNSKIYNCIAVGGKYVKAAMESKGSLFWKFSDVDAAAVGKFTDENPRLAGDRLHVKVNSPALSAGVAPSEAGYDESEALSLSWHNYSSADIDGNALVFNANGTAAAGAAHEPVSLLGFVISFR